MVLNGELQTSQEKTNKYNLGYRSWLVATLLKVTAGIAAAYTFQITIEVYHCLNKRHLIFQHAPETTENSGKKDLTKKGFGALFKKKKKRKKKDSSLETHDVYLSKLRSISSF